MVWLPDGEQFIEDVQCFIQTPKLWGENYDCWGVDDRAPKARGQVTVGDETEPPKASRGWGMGRGYPPPQPTRGSGGAS